MFEALNTAFTATITTHILSTLVDTTSTATNINRPGIQAYHEISTASLWSPISSIACTSSRLPIVPTQTSKPKIYDSLTYNITFHE